MLLMFSCGLNAQPYQRLKGVAIGAGYFSRFQIEAWKPIPEVEITAICDRADESVRAVAGQFGIPGIYTDWKEMIGREQPDFIDIITPPETHEEMCALAAASGRISSISSRLRKLMRRCALS